MLAACCKPPTNFPHRPTSMGITGHSRQQLAYHNVQSSKCMLYQGSTQNR
jgi:hypothetical protein